MPDDPSPDEDAAPPRRPIVKGAAWDLAVIRWVTTDQFATDAPASDGRLASDPQGVVPEQDPTQETDP